MRIAILSRNPKLYSTRRLVEAARARGHTVRILDLLKFTISLEAEYPDLHYGGRPIGRFDAIIPRVGASVTHFGTAVVRQFEQMDVFCANSSLGIMRSRDKLRALQILSRHDIGIPATEFARRREDVLPAIERVGGAPVIIKLIEGTQGVGVILAETDKVAEAIVETLHSARQNVLIQKFVAESKGKDVRAFVIGGRVVAAIRRTAQGQEFRSNVHRGGKPEALDLAPAYERAAIRATQIMGLRIAGVDILEGADGPQIMEVNSSPGLRGIERATGVDVARAVVEYLEDHVSFPEVDLRQKLTVAKGFGVSELPVPRGSELVGRAIAGSGLREQDIIILMLRRDGGVTPLPPSATRIRQGDRLLCFGKLEAMKSFLPKRRRRRVKRRAPRRRKTHRAVRAP